MPRPARDKFGTPGATKGAIYRTASSITFVGYGSVGSKALYPHYCQARVNLAGSLERLEERAITWAFQFFVGQGSGPSSSYSKERLSSLELDCIV